jgi:hypothetical protein
MTSKYTIGIRSNGKSYSVSSTAIVSEFRRLAQPMPKDLTEILQNGIRYSNQDFDVLSSALAQLTKLTGPGIEKVVMYY